MGLNYMNSIDNNYIIKRRIKSGRELERLQKIYPNGSLKIDSRDEEGNTFITIIGKREWTACLSRDWPFRPPVYFAFEGLRIMDIKRLIYTNKEIFEEVNKLVNNFNHTISVGYGPSVNLTKLMIVFDELLEMYESLPFKSLKSICMRKVRCLLMKNGIRKFKEKLMKINIPKELKYELSQ